jgi:hypothetical protein
MQPKYAILPDESSLCLGAGCWELISQLRKIILDFEFKPAILSGVRSCFQRLAESGRKAEQFSG